MRYAYLISYAAFIAIIRKLQTELCTLHNKWTKPLVNSFFQYEVHKLQFFCNFP